jgi:5-methylthioadenosine/S-adenosylhomocysteine deaminase
MIVDTVIHARWIIPVEPESVTSRIAPDNGATVRERAPDALYEYHTLVIDDGRIIDLLPTATARQKYQGTTTENLESHALT